MTTKKRLTATAVALVLLSAACGSDDSSGSDTTKPTEVSAAPEPTTPATDAVDDTIPGTDTPDSTPAVQTAVWNPDVKQNTTPMSADTSASIDDEFATVLVGEDGITGIWVGIWSAEDGQYLSAYGNAIADGAAATIEDHSRIGSNTKTFTATAILQHIDSGDLALDDTIADRLPDLAAKYPDIADITIEQLLGMTSGIPDYGNTGSTMQTIIDDPTKVWTAEELIDLVMTTLPLDPPGTAGYSTTNYLILGLVLEQLEGTPIDQVLTSLATANGLSETALTAPEDNTMPDPSSRGYLDPNGVSQLEELGVTGAEPGDVTDWSASSGGAGGSMYSTIADLGAWAGTGFGTANLSADLAAKRLETKLLPDEGIDYGLGIIDFGQGWIGHAGQHFGWESLALYDTDTGDTAVVILNATGELGSAIIPLATIFPEVVS